MSAKIVPLKRSDTEAPGPAGSSGDDLAVAILEHVRQAILFVSGGGVVADGYSRCAREIFGERLSEGGDIGALLFGDGGRGEARALKGTLELAFAQPARWEMLAGLLPSELRYHRSAAGGAAATAELGLEWRAILQDGRISKVMLLCSDITERKRLETEVVRRNAQHEEQLELIAQLIAHPSEHVDQFVRDSVRQVEEIRKLLDRAGRGFDAEIFHALMRAMHSIKGSARQFRLGTIQKRAHELEALLLRSMDRPPSGDAVEDLRRFLVAEFAPLQDSLIDVQALYIKTVRGAGSRRAEEDGECISVPIRELESLLDAVSARAHPIPLDVALQALARLFEGPVKPLFDRLEHLARSLSEELQLPVRIVREGDGVLMDQRFAGPLYDAFLHAIRNSMDHGAESREERARAGKPEELTLTLSASIHRDEFLVIEIGDDGRGIDAEKVKARAIDKGLLQPEDLKLTPPEKIIQLAFMPGFSTKDKTSYLSGRGIGLDVVKEVVERTLSGDVVIYSEPGKGTRLIARVPLNALARGEGGRFCLFSEETERASMEKLLGSPIADLGGTKARPRNCAILTDLNAAPRAISEHGASLERLVVVDSLDPEQLVSWPLGKLGARHFVDRSNPALDRYLQTCLQKVSGSSIWGLETYLWPGSTVHSETVTEFARKNDLIDEVLKFASGLRCFSGLPEILGLLADEMLMNAMFDAPRDAEGREKYNRLSRTHHLELEPQEAVTLRWGSDPSFVGISIEDPFGALSYETLVSYLKKCYAKGKDQIDRKEGGAGLGLFTIFSSGHCLVVNSAPGKRTEMICLIVRTRSFERYQKVRKSFHFYTES